MKIHIQWEFCLQTIFSQVDHLPMSPHDHHCCLGSGKSWNRVSPIISSLKLDRWVSSTSSFLSCLPNWPTDHSIIGSKILTRPKTTTIWTFLKPVCERAKNKRRLWVTVPVNDFYLVTTKVIFLFPVLSGWIFRKCCSDGLTKKSDSVWSYFSCHRQRGCWLGGLETFA